jgi:ribonuclease HI
MSSEKEKIIYATLNFDGGAVPNPGKGGCGYVIQYENKKIGGSIYLGQNITNNQAEYSGLLHGLQTCIKLGIEHLNVYGDSQLVIEQMNKRWKIKNEALKEYWNNCQNYTQQFKSITFHHVLRDNNKEADSYSDLAIMNEKSLII